MEADHFATIRFTSRGETAQWLAGDERGKLVYTVSRFFEASYRKNLPLFDRWVKLNSSNRYLNLELTVLELEHSRPIQPRLLAFRF